MSKKFFYLFAFFYGVAVCYLAWTTPVSPHEVKLLYADNTIVATLMQSGRALLGEAIFGSFLGIRLYFLLIGFISIFLYYHMSGIYLAKVADRYLATAIYMMLPGIMTALVLANISILVISLVLLFVLAYDRGWIWLQMLVMIFLFLTHDASVIFFISILIYALIHKETVLTVLSGFFVILSLVTVRGVEIGGRPSGYFADMFGLYAALFSPLLFIYFFYTMYRIFLREEKNILWYISFIALLASLVLSVRQRIIVTDFAPYVVISVVLMLDTFHKSLRIRLPQYRKWYHMGFVTVMLVLGMSSLTIVFHEVFFSFMQNPKKHFASKLYEPYWLASQLKVQDINCYNTPDDRIASQLRFYGIGRCRD